MSDCLIEVGAAQELIHFRECLSRSFKSIQTYVSPGLSLPGHSSDRASVARWAMEQHTNVTILVAAEEHMLALLAKLWQDGPDHNK